MTSLAKRLAVLASVISDDAREAPALARGAGFSGVVYEAFGTSLNLPELSATGRRDFRRALGASDCKLVALRAELGRHGLMRGGDIDRLLSQCLRLFETARDLGETLVCLDLGPLPPAPARPVDPKPRATQEMAGLILLPEGVGDLQPPPPAPAHEAAIHEAAGNTQGDAEASDAMAALVEIGGLVDRTTVSVALSASLASFDALLYAMEKARCPWFGIDFDPAAIVAAGQEVDDALAKTGDGLRHVRGRDAVRGERGRSKPVVIGRGHANWSQLLTLLDEAGYGGWITIDPIELPDRRAAAVAGMKQLIAWEK
jgi:sugar phosphate isomerase/epimerase